MFDRLEATERRFDEITAEMARPEVSGDYEKLQSLARERASLEPIVTLYREWRANEKALESAKTMLGDADPEMAALAREEIESATARRGELEVLLKKALV